LRPTSLADGNDRRSVPPSYLLRGTPSPATARPLDTLGVVLPHFTLRVTAVLGRELSACWRG
jgi:hypothetical protein